MLKKRICKIISPLLFFLLIGIFSLNGAELVAKKKGLKINLSAYSDFEMTWMSEMAMVMPTTGKAAPMNEVFDFDQNHLNLIIDAKYQKTRVHLNYESRHSFSTFDGNTGASGRDGDGSGDNVGAFRIAEAYGEYSKSSLFKFRAGTFLSPFGIYNEIRYITPLFATVVLPFIYEIPPNYTGTIMVPSNANLMIYGSVFSDWADISYKLYASASRRNDNSSLVPRDRGAGRESGKAKGLGARVKFGFGGGKYNFGLNLYKENPPPTHNAMPTTGWSVGGGGDTMWIKGVDVEFFLPHSLRFQTEYVIQSQYNGVVTNGTKRAFYARLMYEAGDITPFIMYDTFKDPDNGVYRNTNNRLGTGIGYNLTQNFVIKGEYHYHWFSNNVSGTNAAMASSAAPRIQHMVRTSTIFYF